MFNKLKNKLKFHRKKKNMINLNKNIKIYKKMKILNQNNKIIINSHEKNKKISIILDMKMI